ncbi:MAG: hypothetical protein RLZZ517_53 [Candidatus Parcubacteria bacterium]|jgi:hypothetical protein
MDNTLSIFAIYSKNKELHPFGERLKTLLLNEFYVEAFLYYALEVEDKIKYAIECQEIAVSLALKQYNLKFEDKKDKETPLGELIVRLERYNKNKQLLDELKQFNLLRKKIFHKLLKEDRKKINSEIKKQLPSFYRLVFELMNEGVKNIGVCTEIANDMAKKVKK